MSLRHYAEKYYHMDYNCAEAILLAANEMYALGILNKEISLIAGFGGGMCVEGPCGVMTGGIAALGKMMVKTKAHQTEGLKDFVKDYIVRFKEVLGTTDCDKLKEKYRTDEKGCIETVLLGADVLEEVILKKAKC